DWQGFDRGYNRSKVTLPAYPFQRHRYWVEESGVETPRRPASSNAASNYDAHPLVGRRLLTSTDDALFESVLSVKSPAFLDDHRIYGSAVVPGVAYLEMARAAAAELLETE